MYEKYIYIIDFMGLIITISKGSEKVGWIRFNQLGY
jgi:hypothetical protein